MSFNRKKFLISLKTKLVESEASWCGREERRRRQIYWFRKLYPCLFHTWARSCYAPSRYSFNIKQHTYVCQQCCSNIIIKIEIWFHPSFFSRKVIILLSNHVNLLSHFLGYDFLNDAWEFFPISRSIRRSIFKKGIMISYLVLYLDRKKKKIVNPWDVLCVLRFAWFLRVIRASYTFLFCDDVEGSRSTITSHFHDISNCAIARLQ